MRDYKHYVYYHSEALGLDYCHAKDGSHIYTSDGIRYDMPEIAQLKKIGGIDPLIHKVKSIFGGTVFVRPEVAVPKVQEADIF